MTEELFLISASVLPKVILKTAKAKELLDRGEARTINEAVEQVGISRSAFYKYKDSIFPFSKIMEQKLITLSLLLCHQAGVLSRVINSVTELGGNILTINQNIPVRGTANVSITIETAEMPKSPGELVNHLANIEGVTNVEVVS